ncbi:MAG: hypothetical protein HOH04_09720 [Rhodospirillaceae bacterium]|jgi:uncharacterized tellurite resistance protein B-like protein|nr:hypothetical protein [Rhodospirillaceae bacterium]
MFLHILDKAEKTAFFNLAQQMIVADGIVADAEMAYLDRLYWEAGYIGNAPIADVDTEVDLSVFDDMRSRLVLGAELLIISVVDGEYHSAEAEFANRIIDQLGISAEQHAAICHVAETAADALVSMRNLVG